MSARWPLKPLVWALARLFAATSSARCCACAPEVATRIMLHIFLCLRLSCRLGDVVHGPTHHLVLVLDHSLVRLVRPLELEDRGHGGGQINVGRFEKALSK